MTPAFVLLNPRARAGTAAERYRRFQPTLERAFAMDTVLLPASPSWEDRLAEAIDYGVRLFIAAGGDGTVSALATALFARARRGDVSLESLTLGAIGLGSSNDFHKADGSPRSARGSALPLRLDVAAARLERPMTVTLRDDRGVIDTRTSMVSASIGLVARGNLAFNRGGPVLSFLKRRWTDGAVLLAAARAALETGSVTCSVDFDDDRITGPLTNLSIGPTNRIAGPLAYAPSPRPSSDHLRADAFGATRRRVVLAALAILLAGGRLEALPSFTHRWTRTVKVHADAPFDLEIDGETVRATEVTFTLAPESLRLCAA
jgi:diacylglycerol kinase family enzyme